MRDFCTAASRVRAGGGLAPGTGHRHREPHVGTSHVHPIAPVTDPLWDALSRGRAPGVNLSPPCRYCRAGRVTGLEGALLQRIRWVRPWASPAEAARCAAPRTSVPQAGVPAPSARLTAPNAERPLALRLAAGERGAVEALYAGHAGALRGYIRHFTEDPELAPSGE